MSAGSTASGSAAMSRNRRSTRSDSPNWANRRRLVLVVVGDLQVRHVGGTATQQLDLDLAHTTPDLQNRGALDAVLCQVLDHGRCRRVEAAPAIAAGHSIREPVTEDRP